MTEVLRKPNGDIDWNRFFMGFAVALVFVIQSLHSMSLLWLSENTIPKDKILEEYNASQVVVEITQGRIDDLDAYLRSFELRIADIEQQNKTKD